MASAGDRWGHAPGSRTVGIARFCKDQPELVDDILADVVAALLSRHKTICAELARRIRELEELERIRLQRLHQLAVKLDTSAQRKERHAEPARLDEQVRQRLRKQAEREIAGNLSAVDTELIDIWGSLCACGSKSPACSAIWESWSDAAGI